MDDHDGDVNKAADDLGVATRTLYYYLDDEPALQSVETSADKEEKEEKKEDERKRLDREREERQAQNRR